MLTQDVRPQKKKKKKATTAYSSCVDLSFNVGVLAILSRQGITLKQKKSVFLVAKLLVVLNILVSADPERPSNRAHVV